jgi:hypothetical protein
MQDRGLVERVFVDPFRLLSDQLGAVLPTIVTVVVILLIGGLLAYVVKMLLFRLLTAAKFDRLMDTTGWGSTILRTRLFRSPSDFAARVMQGFIWVFIVLFALSAAGTPMTSELVARFVGYVPDMITAALVLMLASAISKFLARSALLAAVNAQLPAARFLSGAVRVLVMSLGVVVALEQLRIGRTALLVTFAILFAGIVLAAAIAFGYGARDLAKEWMQGQSKSKREEPEEEVLRHL